MAERLSCHRALAFGALLIGSHLQFAHSLPQPAPLDADHPVPTLVADWQVENKANLALVNDNGEVYYVPYQALTALQPTTIDGKSTQVTTVIKPTPANKVIVKKSKLPKKAAPKKKTVAKKVVLKKVPVPSCNQNYINQIIRQRARPRIWCRNYTPRRGVTKSPIRNIPTAQRVVKVCACWANREAAIANNSKVAAAATKTSTKKSTTKKTTAKATTTATPNTSGLTSLDTSDVQTPTKTNAVQTTGTVQTTLESSGNPNSQPFATDTVSPTSKVSVIDTATTTLPTMTLSTTKTAITAQNIFVAVATGAPPPQIPQRGDHPVPRLGIASQSAKLETNTFYANFFLGTQTQTTWTHPYSLAWSGGAGELKSWGLSIAHIERRQLAYGSANTKGAGNPNSYFINPIGIQSVILSASELGANTTLTMDSLTKFSANVNLKASQNGAKLLTVPLVQGMGFITGIYNSATPWIQSAVSINQLTYVGTINSGSTYKYTATLNDGNTWLLYVTPSSSSYPGNTFTLINANRVTGATSFSGLIQVAKIPANSANAQATYDQSAGAYATAGSISGSVQGNTGSYSLSWTKAGLQSQRLLMFALPHHMQTLASDGQTDIQLATSTKGLATAVLADSWTLQEQNLPIDMTFAPWTPSTGPIDAVSNAAAKLINTAATFELGEDMNAQTNLNSMYYSGKGLAKFAAIVYAANDVANNKTLAVTGLKKLQDAFATFVNNTQIFPLYYESAWGGVVSSSTYLDTSNPYAFNNDFGNTYYNDHQFHYGYFVYAAAVIGYIDPTWLTSGNRAWVNTLIRDYANPVDDDYFPFSRSFDWFHGHSWAKGLFESADGKDQESSSEDSNAYYAIKMWGKISGDAAMEARGSLQLAVQARAVQNYFLYQSNNTVQPPSFIGNKAAGILFENKIDHTTYFGTNVEYIQGIHMIPLMPFSTLTRTKAFVTEEWNTYFSSYAATVTDGWRGILMANLAIIQPSTAYKFFADPNFDYRMLDGGASLTWYLTFSAALGGSPAASSTAKREVGSGLVQLAKRALSLIVRRG